MKNKILEILDDTLEAYSSYDEGFINEKSVQAAADKLAQIMCDREMMIMHAAAVGVAEQCGCSIVKAREKAFKHVTECAAKLKEYTEQQYAKAINKLK